jgi:hypothetical protein
MMTATKEPTRQDINDACAHFERLVRLGAFTTEDSLHVHVLVCAANLDIERAERIANLERQNHVLQECLTKHQSIARYQLRHDMSDISERCWCASWIMGNEFALWSIVQNGPCKWGQDEVDEGDIARLKEFSDISGGWFYWDDEEGEKFVPTDEWVKMVEAHNARD